MKRTRQSSRGVVMRCSLAVLGTAILAASIGCAAYTWNPETLAEGYTSKNESISVQWIGKGYQLMFGHGIYGTPTSGHYRALLASGQKYDFDVPEFGYCYYPNPPLHRSGKILDEDKLIIVGPRCGSLGRPTYAVLYSMTERKIRKIVEFPEGIPDPSVELDQAEELLGLQPSK